MLLVLDFIDDLSMAIKHILIIFKRVEHKTFNLFYLFLQLLQLAS